MLQPAHPEVLHPDWLPPVALYRRQPIDELVQRLLDPAADGPVAVGVVGPDGSGTSTVARLGVRLAGEELRRRSAGPTARVITVRVPFCRGAHGVATELLQSLDSGFRGSGFNVTEIVAGFLRRLRREDRPSFLLLDDVRAGAPDLAVVLRALLSPARFLPEGVETLRGLHLVLAGNPDARSVWTQFGRFASGPPSVVTLPAYTDTERRAILADRMRRALGRPASEEWGGSMVTRALARPRGIVGPMDRLRRELTGSSVPFPGDRRYSLPISTTIEPPLLAALRKVADQRRATVAEIRQWEAEFARAEGARPLAPTTFWRRIVRLESAGMVHREVRSGGAGGTRSLVEVVAPVSALIPSTIPLGTHPTDGWNLAGGSMAKL